MKVMSIMLTVLVVLVGLCATPVSAQGLPLPHAFYGTVEINDNPASVGTQIEARGEGVIAGEGNPIMVTEAGLYGGPEPLAPKLVVQGDIEDGATLTFYVNGAPADQTAEWHSGAITELDLTVTMPVAPPTVTTNSATDIDNTTTTLNGILNDLGDTSLVDVSFEWGTTTGYGNETDTQAMTSTGPFSATLSGLAPNTTYHFRAKAVGEGTTYGIDRTFTTTSGTTPEDGGGDTTLPVVSDISVSPSEVNIGETVTICVLVTNTGDDIASCTIMLKINGEEEKTKEVTLGAGASEEVTFATAKDVAGSYSVDVNGLSGSFIVKENSAPPPEDESLINWPVFGGVTAGIVIVGLIIFLMVRRRAY
jgi:hypothetical protein